VIQVQFQIHDPLREGYRHENGFMGVQVVDFPTVRDRRGNVLCKKEDTTVGSMKPIMNQDLRC
jgi:hypothetical protein